MDHDRSFDDDLDHDTADEELDGTELASIEWLQIHYGGPASSVGGGIQLMQVDPAWHAASLTAISRWACWRESVELDVESPEAYAHAVAEWIESSIVEVTDAVEYLTSQVDFNKEMLKEIEDNTS